MAAAAHPLTRSVYPVAAMTTSIGPRQLDAWAATISNRNG
jgi:hypothetical protein